jgi:trimeric autotransporter adhesin
MFDRSWIKALAGLGLAATITSCGSTPSLTSIVISPTAYTVTLALLPDGAPAPSADQLPTNYKAIGYYTRPGHIAETQDITNSVTWFSFTPDMVTVNGTGVATPTGFATGFTQIWASAPGFDGDIVSNQSTYTVELPTDTTTGNVVSIAIQNANPTPAVNTNESLGATGVTGNGDQMNLTKSCVWTSSNTSVATVSSTGVLTTVSAGTASISATYKNAGGLEATGVTSITVQ